MSEQLRPKPEILSNNNEQILLSPAADKMGRTVLDGVRLQEVESTIKEVSRGIDTVFWLADRHASANSHRIGYDHNSLVYEDPSNDGTSISLYVGMYSDSVNKVAMSFPGTKKLRNGDPIVRSFYLSRSNAFAKGLYQKDYIYDTQLVELHPETGEASFPKGIGPKRQKKAVEILKMMQARIEALDKED